MKHIQKGCNFFRGFYNCYRRNHLQPKNQPKSVVILHRRDSAKNGDISHYISNVEKQRGGGTWIQNQGWEGQDLARTYKKKWPNVGWGQFSATPAGIPLLAFVFAFSCLPHLWPQVPFPLASCWCSIVPKAVKKEWGVEPTPFTLKHVQNDWGDDEGRTLLVVPWRKERQALFGALYWNQWGGVNRSNRALRCSCRNMLKTVGRVLPFMVMLICVKKDLGWLQLSPVWPGSMWLLVQIKKEIYLAAHLGARVCSRVFIPSSLHPCILLSSCCRASLSLVVMSPFSCIAVLPLCFIVGRGGGWCCWWTLGRTYPIG